MESVNLLLALPLMLHKLLMRLQAKYTVWAICGPWPRFALPPCIMDQATTSEEEEEDASSPPPKTEETCDKGLPSFLLSSLHAEEKGSIPLKGKRGGGEGFKINRRQTHS